MYLLERNETLSLQQTSSQPVHLSKQLIDVHTCSIMYMDSTGFEHVTSNLQQTEC